MSTYIYRGDRLTDPALRGVTCEAVRFRRHCVTEEYCWLSCEVCDRMFVSVNRTPGTLRERAAFRREHPEVEICVRGANGNMLVTIAGVRHVVLGRQLRKMAA